VGLGQQHRPVHRGHARVGHEQVDGLGSHDFQGLGTTAGQQHIIRLAPQQATQAVEDRFFIVDQQNSRSVRGRRSSLFIHGDTSWRWYSVASLRPGVIDRCTCISNER